MKFKATHKNDILALTKRYGIEDHQISFRKKKGRIYILRDEEIIFSYFQKLEFKIDLETKKRIDLSYFEIKSSTNNEIHIVKDWNAVINALEQTLRS